MPDLDLSAYEDFWFNDPMGRLPGQPLNPKQFTKEDLGLRKRGNARKFAALWQQSPRPLSGDLVRWDWFNIIDPTDVPKIAAGNTVRAWDFAFSEKQVGKTDPDWTVGVKLGLYRRSSTFYFVLLDLVRFREKWHTTKNRLVQVAKQDGSAIRIFSEHGGPQNAAVSDLENEPRLGNHRYKTAKLVGDKLAAAQPWFDVAESGRFMVVSAPWNADLKKELVSFPYVAHEDQVDAISLAYWALEPKLRGRSITVMSAEGLWN